MNFSDSLSGIAKAWSPGSVTPVLPSGQVDVWLADLDSESSQVGEYFKNLSAEEQTRASRFRAEQDRQRYIVAKGILRSLLQRYLGMEASQISIVKEPNGKPELKDIHPAGRLNFNQSHSANFGVYALSWNRRVGVDLEQVRPLPDLEPMAELVLTEKELKLLRSLSKEKQMPAFFSAWTRKEAFVKALGEGLSRSLKSFEIAIPPPSSSEIIHDLMGSTPMDWSVRVLPLFEGFFGAVCGEGRDWKLACKKWRKIL